MKQLPNIAKERLRAQPLRPAGSMPPDGAPDHLDTNLVAAFVENNALPAERTRVMEHLASCDRCRAEVRLVLATARAGRMTAAEQDAPREFRWNWLLRWEGAAVGAALALVLVAFVVSTEPARGPGSKTITLLSRNVEPQPAQIAGKRETAGSQKSPITEAPPLRAQANAHAFPKVTPSKQEVRDAESKMLAPMADSKYATVLNRLPASPPSPPRTVPSEAFVSIAGDSLSPTGRLAVANPIPRSDQSPNAVIVNGAPAVNSPPAAKAVPAPTLMSVRPTAARVVEPDVRWTIPDNVLAGAVEESTDGGRSWRPMIVAPGVRLRVVFALDRDVWAGGAAGSLFHSSNQGLQWTQVQVSSNGVALAGDIVAIQFGDVANGLVTTANGERWTTSDGGVHWQKAQ